MKHLCFVSLSLLSLACSTGKSMHIPLPSQEVEISSRYVARVYILEAPVLSDGLQGVTVEENDLTVGTIQIGNYLCWEREPGDCLIEVTFDQMEPVDGDNVIELVDTTLEPGEVYYYGLTLDPMWKRPKVRLLARDEARALLKNLTPVQD